MGHRLGAVITCCVNIMGVLPAMDSQPRQGVATRPAPASHATFWQGHASPAASLTRLPAVPAATDIWQELAAASAGQWRQPARDSGGSQRGTVAAASAGQWRQAGQCGKVATLCSGTRWSRFCRVDGQHADALLILARPVSPSNQDEEKVQKREVAGVQ